MKVPGNQLSLFETRNTAEAFSVRVSPRARRLTARVHVGGRVEIVVPHGVAAGTVREFVQRFTPWIHRKVAVMQSAARCVATVPERIDFALTGESFAVEWQRTASRRLRQRGMTLLVAAPDEHGVRQLLRAWLRRSAGVRLSQRLLGHAARLGASVSKISIRCQRTRWGSCSSRGTVSLNCCLVFLSEEVVRYLCVHELSHLSHMNHSARFWATVESHEPDFRRLDAELLAGWRTVPQWVFGD